MRASVPAVVVTAILGVLVEQLACNPEPTYVSQDHFAQAYAQALCSSLQGCCAENGISQDYGSCESGWEKQVNNLLYGPTSTGNYNITLATSCIDEVRAAQGQSCQPLPGSLSAARGTCQSIFQGQVPLGGPCSSAADCAQMDGSIITCATVPGDAGSGSGGGQLPLAAGVSIQGVTLTPSDVPVCVAEAPPDAGMGGTMPSCSIDSAAGTDTCTATGAYCDPMMLVCMPQAGAAGKCDPSVVASCLPGFYCVGSGMTAGTCAMAGPVGSPCTAAVMCDATGMCDAASTKTCVPILQPGAACTASNQCSSGVCDPTAKICLSNAIATTAACNGQF
ncbi:MAG TPA: hypothetical protein VHS09_14580 [Polyangiaceae bacterium]|nr:hypothetical protein [Polyangiaceae bacterium]